MAVEVADRAFMCRCSEESCAEADAVLARAREILGKDWPVKDDRELVNRAIVWLSLEGEFTFAWDQWGAISVKPFEMRDGKPLPDQFKIREPVWIQCDEPIDGLAAAIVHYFGDGSMPTELA